MSLNGSDTLIIEDRRREVAALRRRRYTARQIERALAQAGRTNPRTGRPWSLGTIQADLTALHESARRESIRDISEHRAEVLADLHELLRIAWADKRWEDARKVIKDVRDMLGTDAPQVIVYEQIERHMTAAVEALQMEFRDDPAALDRALSALMGADRGAGARPLN